MMSGLRAQRNDEIETSQRAGMRWTKNPTLRLMRTPTRRLGRR
jgi:hypothetical protein